MEQRRKVLIFLIIGLVATSFPAILVKMADAGALAISFYRNFLASLFIFPIAVVHFRKFMEYKLVFLKIFIASFFLAFHFYSWNASLQMTTVASSLVIVATQPIWSAQLGVIFLREKVSLRGYFAIFLALTGIVFIAIFDLGKGKESIFGDLLALLAAICASAYFITGRSVRDRIPLSLWLFSLYFISSIILLGGCFITSEKLTGFTTKTYFMFFLMALIPSFIGHSLLNYTVRFIEAYKIQLGLLLEPFVSTLLAFFIFLERPPILFYPAAMVSLSGVILGITEIHSKTAQP